MGAWGIGLYSCDFARDLRTCVAAVARLPFAPEQLLETVVATQPSIANDPKDSDHTVFWLVVADQFARRGIDCPAACDRALAIIADGDDIAAMAALGMDERSLRKRGAMLVEIRERLLAPACAKPRAVLKAPQRLLLAVGEVIAYPICLGHPINPYAVGKEWAWVKAWKQDGWGAFVVVERGHVFDFLAWYRPVTVAGPLVDEPTLAQLTAPRAWLLREAGTLTSRHGANMRFRSLGAVPIDPVRLAARFPARGPPMFTAVNDISLCENIAVRPLDPDQIRRLERR